MIGQSFDCVLDSDFKCRQCGRQYKRKTFGKCPKGGGQRELASRKKLRPRTPEEIESALLICIACEHRTAEGLCGLLKREGCGSCRTIADFSAKLRRGIGCPDRKFPATEIEPARVSGDVTGDLENRET